MIRKLLQLGGILILPFVVGLTLSVIPDVPELPDVLAGSGGHTVAGGRADSGIHTIPDGLPPAGDGKNAEVRYPEELPAPLTGGFGEESCHSCHFDYDLNLPDGSLTVEGLDETWRPGQRYEISLTLVRESLGRGGFQMTSRFGDGRQAGRFEARDDRVTFTPGTPEEVQYLQHSQAGVEPETENQAEWHFEWIAPDTGDAPILFHIAANASNGDRSEFGDWIYLNEITLRPHE